MIKIIIYPGAQDKTTKKGKDLMVGDILVDFLKKSHVYFFLVKGRHDNQERQGLAGESFYIFV